MNYRKTERPLTFARLLKSPATGKRIATVAALPCDDRKYQTNGVKPYAAASGANCQIPANGVRPRVPAIGGHSQDFRKETV